jgi:hypothetical protein
VAAGRDLDEAFGLIEVGEKAAGLFMKNRSLGKALCFIDPGDLEKIAMGFGVEPDREILNTTLPARFSGKSEESP